MLSLPIIFREFRVAARRKRTFGARCVLGGLLAAMVFIFLVGHMVAPSSQAMGRYLLHTFAWEIFLLVFMVAPAMTCGCVSEERKEGTLELLFLTHLNPADVVLGKFVGKGFDALMLFLAATPFLFVPILLGGVDWDLTLGVALTVLSLLLLGLALGLFCSVVAGSTDAAFAIAYIGLTAYNAVLVALPLIKGVPIPFVRGAEITMPDWLRLGSPLNGLIEIGTQTAQVAFITLLCCGTLAALLLGYSVWRLPRSFVQPLPFASFWQRMPLRWFPWVRQVRRSHRRFSGRNLILWLDFLRGRTHWLRQLIFALVLCLFFWIVETAGWKILVLGVVLWFCTKIIIVIHVARTFASEKMDGSLEMLLTAPFTNRQIVRGRILSVLARYGIWCTAVAGLAMEGGIRINSGVIALFLPYLMASELACVVCVCMLISARAKTVTQATTWGVVATVFISTFLHGGSFLCPCSFLAEPLVALIAYLVLVSNLRQFATR